MSDEIGRPSGSIKSRDSLFVAKNKIDRDRRERYEFGPFLLEPAERKLKCLEKGFQDRSDLMVTLNADPVFDGIRTDRLPITHACCRSLLEMRVLIPLEGRSIPFTQRNLPGVSLEFLHFPIVLYCFRA